MNVATITALVPMAHVADVSAATLFYAKPGFDVANSVTPSGSGAPNWVLLRSNRAELMWALASEPVVAEQQAVLFYTYSPDIAATQQTAHLPSVSFASNSGLQLDATFAQKRVVRAD